MISHTWNKYQLSLFGRYIDLKGELQSNEEEFDFSRDEINCEILLLESKLIIDNNYVVGYHKSQIKDLYTFKEALALQDFYLKYRKELFTFRPVGYEASKDFK